jgi:hypothetical protein
MEDRLPLRRVEVVEEIHGSSCLEWFRVQDKNKPE